MHAIGKWLLLAEIQQTSDVTYRIYDWDRIDLKGNSRMLHNDEALEALDYSRVGSCKLNFDFNDTVTNVVSCKYFTTNKIRATEPFKRIVDKLILL